MSRFATLAGFAAMVSVARGAVSRGVFKPHMTTQNGDITFYVADGKRIGMQVGEYYVSFTDLPNTAKDYADATVNAMALGRTMAEPVMAKVPAEEMKLEMEDKVADAVAELNDRAESTLAQANLKLAASIAEVDLKIANTKNTLSRAQQTLSSDLNTKAATIEAETAAAGEKVVGDLNAGLKSGTDAIKEMADKIAASKKLVDGVATCAAQGLVYDSDDEGCKAPTNGQLSKIHYRRLPQRNWQGMGNVPTRDITFEKKHDDTAIRITYYDNFRIGSYRGHSCWTHVRLRIDNHNCNDPGDITWHRHSQSGRHGGRYQNNHHSSHMTGVCKRTGQGEIKKGRHTIQVNAYNHNGCHLYSGWDGQHAYLAVEEVYIV